MVKQNGKIQNAARVGALTFLAVFAASAVFALSPDGRPGERPRRQREARRASEIRIMDIFVQNYGAADWSLVTAELQAHPDGAQNAAIISIPLSLGNVYLNRYESGHDKADLERAIVRFEQVVSNQALWRGRSGSGSVVSYLDISLSRLDAECDIGGFETRISALWQAAMTITAEEADFAQGAVALKSISPVADEEEASRASVLAAAASFLAGDSRAESWGNGARQAASRLSGAGCKSGKAALLLSEGSISYRLVGSDVPAEFVATGCLLSVPSYETGAPVEAVAPGETLDRATRDSGVVTYHLTHIYLLVFPPGSQCVFDEEFDDVVDMRR